MSQVGGTVLSGPAVGMLGPGLRRDERIRVQIEPSVAWLAAWACVEEATGLAVPRPVARAGGRGGRVHDAATADRRRIAVYVAVCGLGVSARRIAPWAGLSRSVAHQFVSEVEDRRDGPFEAVLERLEALARAHVPIAQVAVWAREAAERRQGRAA